MLQQILMVVTGLSKCGNGFFSTEVPIGTELVPVLKVFGTSTGTRKSFSAGVLVLKSMGKPQFRYSVLALGLLKKVPIIVHFLDENGQILIKHSVFFKENDQNFSNFGTGTSISTNTPVLYWYPNWKGKCPVPNGIFTKFKYSLSFAFAQTGLSVSNVLCKALSLNYHLSKRK